MQQLTFDTLKDAWGKLKKNRATEMKKVAPDLSDPDEIYLKRVSESDVELAVRFAGFRHSVQQQTSIPQIKRLVINWLKHISVNVQQVRSDDDSLVIRMSKELKMSEAAISIFKRDPKTNKKKSYYKCIGGKKNGRRVANPNDCIGVPDPMKKIKFSITKRAKYGQAAKSRKKTQLTNVTARRIRVANKRLKKARGF
jgi:hypothetical protein